MKHKGVKETSYVYVGCVYSGDEAKRMQDFRKKEDAMLEELRYQEMVKKRVGIYAVAAKPW